VHGRVDEKQMATKHPKPSGTIRAQKGVREIDVE